MSNTPFTPRSTTFPDDLESDSEDVFEPTPVHSPGGPHYDDLPPTYDEAQQQALHDARNGIPPLDPNNVEVHRLHLSDNAVYQLPPNAEVREHRATATEIEQENRRTGLGGGINVPIQQVENSEQIPIGRVQDRNTTATQTRTPGAVTNPADVLLSTALEFTKHEPDADARYAPRLTRCVAIPQEGLPASHQKWSGAPWEGGRRGRRGGRGRGRGDRHVPGQWPESSAENLAPEAGSSDESAQFLRAYAKALHAHSIRPAEFLDFLDGLNALCAATNTSPADLVSGEAAVGSGVDVVRNYIAGTNEAFFAPRGLKVSVKSLPSLLAALNIPEERGQRAGAVVSVLDDKTTADKRAQALHPWIEALETNVPEPSIATLMLREMGERFRHPPPPQTAPASAQDTQQAGATEKTTQDNDDSDPPHSIPGAYPGGPDPTAPTWAPSWGGWRNRGSWGRGGRRGQPWGPFGAPGNGPFGPPGFGPFGPPGHGPFGPRGHAPWGAWRGGPGVGCGASSRGAAAPNSWEAWGQSLGKWGEEFGKKMEVWGEQFGKRAEEWGDSIARNAGGAGPSGSRAPPHTMGQQQQTGPDVLRGQETGVHRDTPDGPPVLDADVKLKPEYEHELEHDEKDHHDDDASSVSSDSSDSDLDSDADDAEEKEPDAAQIFAARIHDINAAASASAAKGKKSPAAIEHERAAAIAEAEKDRSVLETRLEARRLKRAIISEYRAQRRGLVREYLGLRRVLRQQGYSKRSTEWRELKKEYRAKKGELRKEKQSVKRDLREAKWERKKEHRAMKGEMRRAKWEAKREAKWGAGRGLEEEHGEEMVWVVVENLV